MKDGKDPPLELLQTLVLFADGPEREAAAVAKRLGLDKSTVVKRLQQLTHRYGLLRKAGRHLDLTDKGRQAVAVSRALLRQHDQLAGWLNGRREAAAVVTAATGRSGAELLLPAALAHFRAWAETAPGGWEARAVVKRGRDRVLGVADGTLDLAVVTHDREQVRELLGPRDDVAVEVLLEEPLCVAAHRDTEAGRALERSLESQPVALAKLAKLELAVPDRASGVRRQLERAGVGVGLRFGPEASSWPAAREYARHRLCAAVLPLSAADPGDRSELAIRLIARPVRLVHLMLHRPQDPSEGRDTLLHGFRAAAAEVTARLQRRWGGIVSLG